MRRDGAGRGQRGKRREGAVAVVTLHYSARTGARGKSQVALSSILAGGSSFQTCKEPRTRLICSVFALRPTLLFRRRSRLGEEKSAVCPRSPTPSFEKAIDSICVTTDFRSWNSY